MRYLFVFCSFLFSLCSQAQTYQSRVFKDVCTEIVLKKITAGKYSFTKKQVANQKEIRSKTINLSSATFEGDYLSFNEGQNVWFIPFNPDFPAMRVNGTGITETSCWEHKCNCGKLGGGTAGCQVSTVGNEKTCTEAGCAECCIGFLVKVNCGSKKQDAPIYFTGGGIFVTADEITQE